MNKERIKNLLTIGVVLAAGFAAYLIGSASETKRQQVDAAALVKEQQAVKACYSNGGLIHLDADMKFIGCDIMGQRQQ